MIAVVKPWWRPHGIVTQVVGSFLAACVLAVGVTAVVSTIRQGDATQTATRRSELLAYEKAISMPAREGGAVIQQGIKVGLRQVASGEPNTVTFQAIAWVDQLELVRKQFAAAADGLDRAELSAAAADFDVALSSYARAAETVGAASIATGDARSTLLEQAAKRGREADAQYDTASARLQRARRAVGLPPTARFPDPEGEK